VLGGLGLQLGRGPNSGDQGDVDVERVAGSQVVLHLADGLEERLPLDVTDGAADLDDGHVSPLGRGGDQDALLDLVGDVRDDLDGAAQVVAPALLPDDRTVDLTRGYIGELGEVDVDEPFVVAQVEVGLGAVVGDEDLAVLIGVHVAGVDVDVRVELLQRDLEAAVLQQPPEGRGRDALAHR